MGFAKKKCESTAALHGRLTGARWPWPLHFEFRFSPHGATVAERINRASGLIRAEPCGLVGDGNELDSLELPRACTGLRSWVAAPRGTGPFRLSTFDFRLSPNLHGRLAGARWPWPPAREKGKERNSRTVSAIRTFKNKQPAAIVFILAAGALSDRLGARSSLLHQTAAAINRHCCCHHHCRNRDCDWCRDRCCCRGGRLRCARRPRRARPCDRGAAWRGFLLPRCSP